MAGTLSPAAVVDARVRASGCAGQTHVRAAQSAAAVPEPRVSGGGSASSPARSPPRDSNPLAPSPAGRCAEATSPQVPVIGPRRLLSPPRRMWESPPGLCVQLQAELKHTTTNRGLGWASDITAVATAKPRAPAPPPPPRGAPQPRRELIPAAAPGPCRPRPALGGRRGSRKRAAEASHAPTLPGASPSERPASRSRPARHHLNPNPGNTR
nr:MEF2-activating motif and SAP domain-containing transcriptional regulator-like [Odocoileus virginianus texanus]